MFLHKNAFEVKKFQGPNIKRVVQGNPELTKKIGDFTTTTTIEITPFENLSGMVKNYWEKANDPDMLPPYGQYIFGDPLKMLDFCKGEPLKIMKMTFLASSILFTATSGLQAGEKVKMNDQISWAIEALEKLDPIDYLINNHEKPGSRNPQETFSEEDKKLLAWNIYHEARGETEEGMKGVLLSTFERLKSSKFPSSVKGVVFQSHQYSWTLKIPKEEISEKTDMNKFLQIRKLIDQYTTDKKSGESKTFGQSLSELKTSLGLANSEISYTHYHLDGMLKKPFFAKLAGGPTKNRVSFMEYLFKKDQRIKKFGNHLYYPDNITVPMGWTAPIN
jgi:hypothetical protein